ncbi:uncharacterized protein [Nicotiana tomentosiformis]|uniref:uncharacterized protein n=1 Tax=Nicotiana tomentosiformis TaxID=4098 RepID=UPI00388C6E15
MVTLAMPGLPRLEWRGTLNYVPSTVVSFLKAQCIVEKGCDAYLEYVRDVSVDTSTVEKANVVTYALSHKAESLGRLAYLQVTERSLALDVQVLDNQFVRLDVSKLSQVLACVVSQSSLYDRIRERQYDNPYLFVLKDTVQHGDAKKVTIGDDGVLRMQGKLCVHNVDSLRELILYKAHSSRKSLHPGVAKMYLDLRQHY